MNITCVGFNWDSGNWPKCGKHGVTKEEIEEVFFSYPYPAIMPDPYPDEPRMRAIGTSNSGRYIFLVFMFRLIEGQTFIRPISARYMHQKEIERYERTKSKSDAFS